MGGSGPAGESLVFFFRMLPFLRAAVSIPAGLTEMGVGKFTLYSAAGSLVFNAVLAYSAYTVRANPGALAEIRRVIAYSTSRWPFFLVLAGGALVAAYLLYRRRQAYLRAPQLAVQQVLGTSAIAAMIAGLILLGQPLRPQGDLRRRYLGRSRCGSAGRAIQRFSTIVPRGHRAGRDQFRPIHTYRPAFGRTSYQSPLQAYR